MWPDQEYLVKLVATLSDGDDEIFELDYVPSAGQLKKNIQPPIMVHNHDGLLTVPPALLPKRQGRAINMLVLTHENKLQAKLMLSQQRLAQHQKRQDLLVKELERAKQLASGMTDKDLSIKEMRAELEKTYQEQAQLYINQQLAERGAEMQAQLQAQFEEAVQQRLNASAGG